MPRRQSIRRVASEAVQGEDSYIIVRKMTVGEHTRHLALVADAQQAQADGDSQRITAIESEMTGLLASCVRGWNWVDDDDEPLPSPAEDEDVLQALTLDEVEFIVNAIRGNVDSEKKAP